MGGSCSSKSAAASLAGLTSILLEAVLPHHTAATPPPPQNAQVVLTNHVTTRPGEDGGAPPRLIPVLGDTWAHVATSRLMLYWEAGARRAFLYKSPSQPPASCEYLVTGEGIRGRRQPAKRGPEGECRGEAAKK